MSRPVGPSLACREDSASSSSGLSADVFFTDPLRVFIINVGGSRFALPQELLACYPDTRLGKLSLCGSDAVHDLCDDPDLAHNEFFFDRNAHTFQYVVNFYRTGRLHLGEEECEVSFLQEMQYWGIEELRVAPCCQERFQQRKEQQEVLEEPPDLQPDQVDEDFDGAACPALRRCLWDFLEKPDSSRAARTFGSLSVFFVVVSVVNMVLISLDLGEGPGLGTPLLLDILEYVCVVWFTGELLLRFFCVRNKCRFSRSVPNLIDLMAVLPFYVTLALENLHGGSAHLENVGRVVQVLRLLRSLRMLKLGRHSTGLRSLGLTITQCYEEVGLLLLFLGVGISIFSSVVFALEHDFPASTFSSVPAAWWWATTSMTTVGYGDVRPDTAGGKVLAFVCILSGILILALPIAIINDRFSTCYLALRLKEAAARHDHVLQRLGGDEGGGVNLRDAYARDVMQILRMKSRGRSSARGSKGEELWW